MIGYPKTIRIGQGSEFVSHDLYLWACVDGVILDLSGAGKHTDDAFFGAFNAASGRNV